MKQHVVKSGETFNGLAQKYELTSEELRAANPAVLPSKLQIGQTLKIPVKVPLMLSKKPKVVPAPVKKEPTMTFDDFQELLFNIEEQYNLPQGLLNVIAFCESSGNPFSNGGDAKGMFQATSIFLKDHGLTDPYDLVKIPRATAAFIAHAYNVFVDLPELDNYPGFGWDPVWELACGSYHAGVTGTMRWVKEGCPADHKHVGKKTLTYMEKIANYMANGFNVEILRQAWDKAYATN